MAESEKKKADGGRDEQSGGASDVTTIERVINRHVGDSIHLFLSLISILILIAAVVAAYQTVIHDFPKLLGPSDEYNVLQKIIENILLIAIAGELGFLLLYHRT